MKTTVLAVLLLAATHAWGAPPWDGRRGAPEYPRGPQREQAAPWRGPPPERRMQRDDRRDRLSEEERRALHHDLDRANRELYRRR